VTYVPARISITFEQQPHGSLLHPGGCWYGYDTAASTQAAGTAQTAGAANNTATDTAQTAGTGCRCG